jgi:hypothetical protein
MCSTGDLGKRVNPQPAILFDTTSYYYLVDIIHNLLSYSLFDHYKYIWTFFLLVCSQKMIKLFTLSVVTLSLHICTISSNLLSPCAKAILKNANGTTHPV